MHNHKSQGQGPKALDDTEIVTAEQLNIRDQPNGKREGVLPKDTKVHVIGQQDNWKEVEVEISSPQQPPQRIHGFVDGRYLAPAPTPVK